MPAIPFPLSSSPGIKPQEGGGRLINCFAEKQGEGARFPVLWRRTPGMRQRVNVTGHSHLRGGIVTASTLLVVYDSRCYSVTKSGTVYTATNLGALAGTSPVTCAVNNNATPQIVCVDVDNGAYNLLTGSAPTAFADADLPQPNSVSELDGYFIFTIGDGRIFATGLNAVTVDANSYTTEQGLTLRRGVTFRSEFYAFGNKWTGVYRDAGTSPFPLERRFTIPRGIIGTFAVAGWEPGWTNELIWVGDDHRVYRLNGYTPEPISTPDVERAIESASDYTLIEASVYMVDGNPFWVLTSPDEWTWEYNAKTQNWNERKSDARDDWRGSQTIMAFNEWICGDRTSGKLLYLDPSYYREDTDPLTFELQSGIVAAFPSRTGMPRTDFDFTGAVGSASGEDPVQTDPMAQISWSNDGGYSWSDPVDRRLGSQGETVKVTINRTGIVRGKGRRYKLRVSDPVHVGFMGGQVATVQLAP